MPKVSIVMPSLNVSEYIEKCMDSVLGQTIEDIEIICVDADSADGTREILEQYAKNDSRIILLRDDRRSTGYAKNLGIDVAKGEYIGIVEPDDYIERDMYERLYDAAIVDRADVVKCDYSVYVTFDNQHFFVPKKLSTAPADYGELMNPQKTLRPFGWEMYTWAGIYRAEFLREKKIKHHETKGAAYQDIGFWFQCFAESERVKLIPGTGYLYCQDNPGASVKDAKRLIRGLDELDWVKKLYEDDSDGWDFLQPAWGLGVIRFAIMASYNLTGEALKLLLVRAHEMIKNVRMDDVSINALFRPKEYSKYQLLSASYEAFESAHKEKLQMVRNEQHKLLAEIEAHENLVIVSAGSHGANLQALIKNKCNRVIKAFADNDVVKQGKSLNGVVIMSIEEATNSNRNGFFLVANQNYSEELTEQLLRLGVKKDMVYVVPVDRVVDTYL